MLLGRRDMNENKHPTINMRAPGTLSPVPIDQEIVPLIKAMWALGIETSASCQDFEDSGAVQLVLPTCTDLHLFLTLVARNASKQVARGAARAGLPPAGWPLHVWSAGWERGKFTSVELCAAIHFPRHQLEEVTRVLVRLAAR
jgi:hypothetical protein